MGELPDKCFNCGSNESKTFWDYSDGTMLCDKCENEVSEKWEKEHNHLTNSKLEKIANKCSNDKKENYVSKKRDYAEDILKYHELSVPPRVFIDSIMTVFLDCRKVSMIFSDELIENKEPTENLLTNLKKDYNICVGLINIPIKEGRQCLLFFFKDFSVYKTLNQISNYAKEIAPKYLENPKLMWNDWDLNKALGDLLGYPECCIKHRHDLTSKGECVEIDCKTRIMELSPDSKDNGEFKSFNLVGTGFFTFEFYPCNPYCKNAAMIDDKISKTFEKEDERLFLAYKYTRAMNTIRIINPKLDWAGVQRLFQEYNDKVFRIFYKEP